jgi:hypothetical protein
MDSNVLATSSVIEILDTEFFYANCIVISEVAHELSGTIIGDTLTQRAIPPTLESLGYLKTITDDLVKLGILKTDHGNGEALLLAEALYIRDGDDNQVLMDFMKSRPVIVTNEKAVDAYAKSIGIEAINGREFMGIFNAVAESGFQDYPSAIAISIREK